MIRRLGEQVRLEVGLLLQLLVRCLLTVLGRISREVSRLDRRAGEPHAVEEQAEGE
jgi:hypothetical protein